jgi:tetratricopeptide (TPR) repeat protein
LNLALCQIKLFNFEHALDTLTQLLTYDPHNPKALYLRGKCYYSLKLYQPAYEDFSQALA